MSFLQVPEKWYSQTEMFQAMKKNLFLYPAIVCSVVFVSCKKDPVINSPRTIRYELFTTSNFSADNNSVIFTLQIKKGNQVVWDSVMAPIKTKDIPGPSAKISIDKKVPGDDGKTDLRVGFLYEIPNVGNSWFLDTAKAGDILKLVSFDFH